MLDTTENKIKTTDLEKMTNAPVVKTPFTYMRRFADDMERMFEDFEDFRFPLFGKEFLPFRMETKEMKWMPQLEVLHNNGQFTVRCDLPGMKKDDIKVELKDEMLTISGERHEENKEEREGFYRSERRYGTFYRQVPLPPSVNAETATATFRDGVLEIMMPMTVKEPTVRKLEIKEPTTEKPMAKAAG
jgi:HSP20 family protein